MSGMGQTAPGKRGNLGRLITAWDGTFRPDAGRKRQMNAAVNGSARLPAYAACLSCDLTGRCDIMADFIIRTRVVDTWIFASIGER